MGVRLTGTAQHVATLDHVGACSTAAATAATTTAPTAIATATTAAAAAVAGPSPAAGGAGDNLAAGHVHGHRATAGHCLGGGGCADLGSRARRLVVAGARGLRVQWRLRVGVGAGAAEKEAEGGSQEQELSDEGHDGGGPARGAPRMGAGSHSPIYWTRYHPQYLRGNFSLNPQSSLT